MAKSKKSNPIHFYKDYPTDAEKISFLRNLIERRPIGYQKIMSSSDYNEVKEWLWNAVPKLQDPKYTNSTRIYWILHGLTDFPKCANENCNHAIGVGQNIKVTKGYSVYCSKKCSANSSTVKANFKDTFRRKYGVDNPSQIEEVKQKISVSNKIRRRDDSKEVATKIKRPVECKLDKPISKSSSLTIDAFNESKAFLDLQNSLGNPNYNYHANCTKDFANAVADEYLDREFERIQAISFPRTTSTVYTTKHCLTEIETLVSKDKSIKTASPTVKTFHTSLIYAQRGDSISPWDGWQKMKTDRDYFRRYFVNRILHSDWLKAHPENLVNGDIPEQVYGVGLTTSGFCPIVSYFKPHLAKHLVQKYLSEFSIVFDPFSGYSGRMMGTLTCGKNYIGRDLNAVALEESKQIYSLMEPILEKRHVEVNCDLDVADAEKNVYYGECLFTCPPYADIEKYPIGDVPIHDCDEWIDICLRQYSCKKYLFVVDGSISKWKDYVVEILGNSDHYGMNSEHVVLIES